MVASYGLRNRDTKDFPACVMSDADGKVTLLKSKFLHSRALFVPCARECRNLLPSKANTEFQFFLIGHACQIYIMNRDTKDFPACVMSDADGKVTLFKSKFLHSRALFVPCARECRNLLPSKANTEFQFFLIGHACQIYIMNGLSFF